MGDAVAGRRRGLVERPLGDAPRGLDVLRVVQQDERLERRGGGLAADDARLAGLVAPRIAGTVDLALLERAMPVLKVRARDLNELASGAAFLFRQRPLPLDEKAAALLTAEARALLAGIQARLESQTVWTTDDLEATLKAMAEDLGLGLGKLAQPLRAALTGQTTSPGIFDVLVLLGRDESLARIAAQAMSPEQAQG